MITNHRCSLPYNGVVTTQQDVKVKIKIYNMTNK